MEVYSTPNSPGRRKRRNKKSSAKKSANDWEGAIENEALPLQLQQLLKNHSKAKILKARNDLFETDEDYDDPQVVRKFLEGELYPQSGSQTSSSNPTPSLHTRNKQSCDSSATSGSSLSTPAENINGKEDPQVNDDAARKTTNHEEKTSSVSSERKVQKSSKLSAEGIEDQKRTLEQVVQSPKLHEVLTGLNHWYDAASAPQVNCFFESDAPRKLFLNILKLLPTSDLDKLLETVVAKLMTPLRAALEERPDTLVRHLSKAFISRIREIIECLRKADSHGDSEKARSARDICSRAIATQFRELRNYVACSWQSLLGSKNCESVLKENKEKLQQMPADTSDLKAMLERRDLHFECMQALLQAASGDGIRVLATDIEDDLSLLQSLSSGDTETMAKEEREARDALEALHSEISESLEPLKNREENIAGDLERLYERRKELQEELNHVNDEIKDKVREKKNVSAKAEQLGERFKEKKELLNTKYHGLLGRCEQENIGRTLKDCLEGVTSDFGDLLRSSKESSRDTQETDDIMSDGDKRYQLVEQTYYSCVCDKAIVTALKNRLDRSKDELSKLRSEAETFKTMDMKNVMKDVERSLARVSSEIEEDESSVATFCEQARSYIHEFLRRYSVDCGQAVETDTGSLLDKERALIKCILDIGRYFELDNNFIVSLKVAEPSQTALDFVNNQLKFESRPVQKQEQKQQEVGKHEPRSQATNQQARKVTRGQDTSQLAQKSTRSQDTSQQTHKATPAPTKQVRPTPVSALSSKSSWGNAGNASPVSKKSVVPLKDLRKQANEIE